MTRYNEYGVLLARRFTASLAVRRLIGMMTTAKETMTTYVYIRNAETPSNISVFNNGDSVEQVRLSYKLLPKWISDIHAYSV